MFSSISTILDVIIFVLSGFIVSSTVAAIVFVVWTFGKINERTSTKELLDKINSSSEKTNTSTALNTTDNNSELIKAAIAIVESHGLSVSGPQNSRNINITSLADNLDRTREINNPKQVLPTPENSHEKMLMETGHVHMKHGDFQSAIKDYTNAIIINPTFAGAYNARGMANRKMKDFHSALQDYNTALSLHNNFAATYNNRGVIYMEIRQIEAALTDFDKALKIEPNSYGYSKRAMANTYKPSFNKSISESTVAVELNPQLPEAYVVRGIAKVQMGALAAADLDFEVAESLGYKRIDIEDRLIALRKG
ncbi:MAG: tetratricopeptide repeat protein [SAR202 cluster bacterium]|nr:tetratricopeptide repeat protein [SAR202 cluster bacterium]